MYLNKSIKVIKKNSKIQKFYKMIQIEMMAWFLKIHKKHPKQNKSSKIAFLK